MKTVSRRGMIVSAAALPLIGASPADAARTAPAPTFPAPDTALVYLYRPWDVLGIEPIRITIDDIKLAELLVQESTWFNIAPGRHRIGMAINTFLWSAKNHNASLTFPGGEVSFVRYRIEVEEDGVIFGHFEVVDKNTANWEMRTTKFRQPVKGWPNH